MFVAFTCDYDNKPWKLISDDSITCLSFTHMTYMLFAIIALLLYYPLTTFVLPGFQFQDKVLDMKYNPTFIITQTQMRVFMIGATTFFGTKNGGVDRTTITVILGLNSFILFVLTMLASFLKPCCLITSFKKWDIFGYIFCLSANLGALLIFTLGKPLYGWIIFVMGVIISLIIIIYLVRKDKVKEINATIKIPQINIVNLIETPAEEKPATTQIIEIRSRKKKEKGTPSSKMKAEEESVAIVDESFPANQSPTQRKAPRKSTQQWMF
eukprot:TRINITY_DN5913_c0_g1_i3.p1 TRINITY_DN5913_c0_g1~~TRINITY_DN5913_c0_g1_i3.p1  ORF type:complete len:268 (-),score=50.02 TRINITY_DN5913_c0_g1_i3:35-838(-)